MKISKFFFKNLFKIFWKFINSSRVFINKYLPFNKENTKIFFGGAIGGNIGGPLVKIRKLKKNFPESKTKFNIVYLISNNVYIDGRSLKVLSKNNIPIILNQNGVYYPGWYKGNYKKRNLPLSERYHAADYVFWQSKFCKRASDKFLGARNGEGEILYNSVDTKLFIPRKCFKQKFTFLITGNVDKKNNYRIISVLEAFKEIVKSNKNIKLLIAGNIEDRNYLVNKTINLNLMNYVTFLGQFSQLEAPSIYQLADAYITLTYQDNCPSAVIEAMSCGLPILYSSSGGVPELVDENSGIGLKVNENWESIQIPNLTKIIEGLYKIIENKEIMSKSARDIALEKFDHQYWFDRHKIIFEKYRNN